MLHLGCNTPHAEQAKLHVVSSLQIRPICFFDDACNLHVYSGFMLYLYVVMRFSQQMQIDIICILRLIMAALVSAVRFSGAASPQTLNPSLTEANLPASQPGLPASQSSTTADATTLGRGPGLQPCSQGGAANGGCHGYGSA